uniref:EGF-like domain-containing protein n=1 Tax=Syphacia muris TaxID=451379 RepID=A0A0N5ADL1_9BILA
MLRSKQHKIFLLQQNIFVDDCSSDDDCQHDGSCVEQTNSLTNRVCYCAYGYYGVNCEKNDLCFNYESSLNKSFNNYGLFNADCYKTHTLNEDDRIYTRVVGNELELIMDYKTASWIAVGWRPLEISKFCRLFPDLENIRWKRDMETNNTSAKQPKDNGFLISALTAELNPMDCTDIITASVIDGRLRINDMYSRDRSTPLVDTWLDGEESLTAAYGIERDGRTVVMFRREISEIEPSDHPLGPGKIFVIYAKGQESMTGDIPKNNHSKSDLHQHYRNDELNYHGSSLIYLLICAFK